MSISLGPLGYPIPASQVVTAPAVVVATAPAQPQPALQVTSAPRQDSASSGRGRSDTPSENQSNPNGPQRGRLVDVSA
jgi:hypothetical protein